MQINRFISEKQATSKMTVFDQRNQGVTQSFTHVITHPLCHSPIHSPAHSFTRQSTIDQLISSPIQTETHTVFSSSRQRRTDHESNCTMEEEEDEDEEQMAFQEDLEKSSHSDHVLPRGARPNPVEL